MSTDDLLTKFDEMVKRFREEFNEIIEGERAKMKAEVEAYNAEKQKIKPFEVNDDDIIDLNVGGQKLTTTIYSLSGRRFVACLHVQRTLGRCSQT